MTDKIEYDAVTSWGSYMPYRTERLYGPDKKASMRLKPGAPVQVIAEHGDALWTPATFLRWENVPDLDGQCQRFLVTMPSGNEHMVDESRIRPVR